MKTAKLMSANWFALPILLSLSACGQHGRPPKSLQCDGPHPAAPAGDHLRAGLHGEGDADPLLQEHTF